MPENRFRKFVYTPAGYNDAKIAVAACRSGGIGILNNELASGCDVISDQMEYLSQKVDSDYGLKLDTAEGDLFDIILGYVGKGFRWLILDYAIVPAWLQRIEELRQNGVRVLVELRTAQWPKTPLDDLIDGLILKGNEAGGFVGESSSFILLQQWRKQTDLPIYVRGGLTPEIAAACCALGVAGGVLDSQILLLDESPFSKTLSSVLKNLSGNETVAVGDAEKGDFFRILVRPGFGVAQEFSAEGEGQKISGLRQLVQGKVDWDNPSKGLLPVGQDICFAEQWQKQYGRMNAVFRAIDSAVENNLKQVVSFNPLSGNSPLAQSLGASLPVIQGPMARVSDNVDFAHAISKGGGLPTVALSLSSGHELNRLLEETSKRLKNVSWGVGLIGFAPEELLEEQMAAVKQYQPRFAVIAGGRPDQTISLEESGTAAFLHVPSANLMSLFIQQGARRFIFEGRECGGHIGPLSSFVLWSTMVDRLLSEIEENNCKGEDIQVLFAGGIHDAFSSAFVQVLALPIVSKGVGIGIQMGSSYLFTREIVDSGALSPTFQKKALECEHTVCLNTGPGHSSRCAYTPFAETFFQKSRQLREIHLSALECRDELDKLQMGRLWLASKGCAIIDDCGELQVFDEDYQQQEGMYMLGQLATLRKEVTDIATLHREVTREADKLLIKQLKKIKQTEDVRTEQPVDIAIIGVAGLFPKANTIQDFWENILGKVNAITEIPLERWDWHLYYDNDRKAKDKVYSKWGGFMEDLVFDPTIFGIPPNSVESVDPMQLMALEVARRTLVDAGYENRPFDKQNTAVIIGASGGIGDVGMQYGVRTEFPRFQGALPESVAERLPEWTEDTFAGILPNVTAGRISNRFDLGGVNFTTDAACSSSLAAIYQGTSELAAGRSNFVIAGGVDSSQGPFGYMCFSKTQALSPTGCCRTFDTSADGIVISEGIAMIAMKRLKDAERDGDRIYAVIKGIGGSSDGRSKALTAPEPEGQMSAMRRAYNQAGFGPESIGMFEAHGTGTVVGDTAELSSTIQILTETGCCNPRQAAVGSVKTLIGHTKATAGIAGIIKVALALHHRVLPPHFPVNSPNELLKREDSPLYLPHEPLPWITDTKQPRRAASSAFGFGGTNFHVVLEEYTGEYRPWLRSAATNRWPSELLLWSGRNFSELTEKLTLIERGLEKSGKLELRHLAFNLARKRQAGNETLAIVASNSKDLKQKIGEALKYLKKKSSELPEGIYCGANAEPESKVAVLFPGQGSQYINMMRELTLHFPVLQETLSEADEVLSEAFIKRFGAGSQLSSFIFPRAVYDEQAKTIATDALTRTDIAQPALGAVNAALWRLMCMLGLAPDMLAGHSYGEFAALFAANLIDFPSLLSISEARGRFIVDFAQESNAELGKMAAVHASRNDVEKMIADLDDIWIANHNAPLQIIISGSAYAIENARKKFTSAGINAQEIQVAAAFHSRFVEPAKTALADLIEKSVWNENGRRIPVYSNTTGEKHAKDPRQIKQIMMEHLVKPVEFSTQIENMYRDGARVFFELGPKKVLSDLTGRILGKERPHKAIAIDGAGGGITGMLKAFAQLLCAGIQLDVSKLFEGRNCQEADPEDFNQMQEKESIPNYAWILNGTGARRVGQKTGGKSISKPPSNQIGAKQFEKEPNIPDSAVKHQVIKQNVSMAVKQPKEEFQMSVRTKNLNSRDSDVMSEYFATMRMFLETQERVMASFMGAGSGNGRFDTGLHGARQSQRTRQFTPRVVTPDLPKFQAGASEYGPVEHSHQPDETPALMVKEKGDYEPGQPEHKIERVQSAETGNGFDEEKITELLLAIVEDKTGYPRDMVSVDQQLEADLGIDSIKRVEIVGALLKALPKNFTESLDGDQKKLSIEPTLKGMVSLISSLNMQGRKVASPFSQNGVGSAAGAPDHSLRYLIEPKHETIEPNAVKRLVKGDFILTRDLLGVAEELAELLRARDCAVHIVEREILQDEASINSWTTSLASEVEAVAGVVHLASIGSDWYQEDTPMDRWYHQLQINEKSLFTLLHNLSDRIVDGAHILSASGLGGFFNRDAVKVSGISLQGGGVGLLKSLFQERPQLRVKAVDIDTGENAAAIAKTLLSELELLGGRQEVGYSNGKRFIFQTVAAPMPTEEDCSQTMQNLVVMATGGLKGITAEVLRDIALAGNTLLVTGRSPLPEKEPDDLRSLATFSELQKYFISEVRKGKLKITPAEIRRKAQLILSEREIRFNIEDLRQRGATVRYYSVDITDHEKMSKVINDIYDQYGRIDGVVHAAGIIEDKLLADKSSESWSRVVDTKVIGLLLLQKYLRMESLRFMVVFSSVAGRYGNSGQSDYATANELMNRLCCQLHNRWENKVNVKALCWGPWGKTTFGSGMVNDFTEAKFAEKGVKLVDADNGRRLFMHELMHSGDHKVEIICGEGPWEQQENAFARVELETMAAAVSSFLMGPLLQDATITSMENGDQVVTFTVGETHSYLQEHRIDGVPVMPAAVALEIMAEGATCLWPEWMVAEVRDCRLLKGIELKTPNRKIEIVISPKNYGSNHLELTAHIQSAQGEERQVVHYRSVLHLKPRLSEQFHIVSKLYAEKKMSVAEAYNEFLFHGPRFQVINKIEGLSDNGAIALVSTTRPAQWVDNTGKYIENWVFDPGLLDAAAQMAILWCRAFRGETALPVKFGKIVRYSQTLPEELTMQFERIHTGDSHMVHANIYFCDTDNQVVLSIEEMECVSSADLNRVGGSARLSSVSTHRFTDKESDIVYVNAKHQQ